MRSLNPFKSLFWKIFIWFWLSISIMLVGAFFVGKLLNEDERVSIAGDDAVARQLQSIENLQRLIAMGVPVNRALRRVSNRAFPLVLLVDSEADDILISTPLPILREPLQQYRREIIQMANSEEILVVKNRQLEIIGPFALEGKLANYQYFAGRLLRPDEQWRSGNQRMPVLALILITGTLLCLFLAWRISKPLKQLSQATKSVSKGDLSTRLYGYEGRNDEIGELAKDFNHMADKLATSIEQQQMLMANISHELRTPLTRLQLASAMLEDNTKSDITKKNITRIESEIAIMDKLIGQAIDLARMSLTQISSVDKARFEIITLSHALAELFQALKFESEAAEKQFIVDEIPNVSLELQVASFQSAIENLTRNAIRFANHQVKIDFVVSGSMLSILISDDGKGLSEQAFNDFLKPFNYDKSTSGQHHSYGLGMAIADAGIKMHEGKLIWQPSLIGGLTLLVEMPIADE